MYQNIFIILCILFVAFHIILSIHSIRSSMIEKLGEKAFSGIFSLLALATFGGAIFLYVKFNVRGPELWEMNHITAAIVYALMLGSFMFLFLSFDNPSPIGMVPGEVPEPKGILRITGHPQNMGLGLLGLAHIIAAGTLGGIFLYGSLAALGFLGAFHQNYNKSLDTDPSVQDFLNKTSVIPFWAILRGKNKLVFSELKIKFIGMGIIAYVIAVVIHKAVK